MKPKAEHLDRIQAAATIAIAATFAGRPPGTLFPVSMIAWPHKRPDLMDGVVRDMLVVRILGRLGRSWRDVPYR
jgi:hypothetical protein